ncbi:MAG: sigma-54-dependent Fis family transcriptional regulator [Gemmatimonadetes bacterium]|nr:sigma-54-dependent Fis family transcriptional regulator [Gemmatimonadota bacterium]
MRPLIYIVDDDPVQVALLTAQVERSRRFRTKGFTDPASALRELETDPPDAIICDLRMPEIDGVEFTRRVLKRSPGLPVIIITARGFEDDPEQAFEAGAADFLGKPVEASVLLARLSRSIVDAPTRELVSKYTETAFDPHGVIGSHPLMDSVRSFVRKVAAVPQVSVLLLGESGTGKSLVARAIHGAGVGSRQRFVEVNCAALPAQLLEAELFGYEKGAFTDARQTKKGLVEVADGGTLFLDEVGTLAPEIQAKLLSFLESRSFRRLGSTKESSVNIRIIAATNVDLESEVAEGNFREDLFYRLNVASYTLPPLRQVRSDIPVLATHFVSRAAAYFGKPVPELDAEGVNRLQSYSWPGNARELRNVIERSMIFSQGRVLEVVDLPTSAVRADGRDALAVPLGLTLEDVEKRYIEATLRSTSGNISAAAEALGVTRKVLWQRRKQHGLLTDEPRTTGVAPVR